MKNIFFNKKTNLLILFLITGFITLGLCSCGSSDSSPLAKEKSADAAPAKSSGANTTANRNVAAQESSIPADHAAKGSRDNTPVCLVPEASGESVFKNEFAQLDASNISEGYVIIRYTGDSHKVKLQITGPTSVTYTYSLSTEQQLDEVFPLQYGNGEYLINVFENIEGTKYSLAFTQTVDVTLNDEFLPFLYPNQYVTFSKDNKAVAKGKDLAYVCNNDLEVVTEVYNFMISNITYDHEEAETVQSGYIPDVDEVLETRTGICLDYAALMTTMLRSQRIPTRMEIGYAGTAYHAWLSTYITDIGWVNGMIEFDGHDWSLMDPTFASNLQEDSLRDFIGDGTNYSVKYIY